MGQIIIGIDLLDWIERNGAQVWPNRVHGRIVSFTVQVFNNGAVVQPTRATLRAALADAVKELDELQSHGESQQPALFR